MEKVVFFFFSFSCGVEAGVGHGRELSEVVVILYILIGFGTI